MLVKTTKYNWLPKQQHGSKFHIYEFLTCHNILLSSVYVQSPSTSDIEDNPGPFNSVIAQELAIIGDELDRSYSRTLCRKLEAFLRWSLWVAVHILFHGVTWSTYYHVTSWCVTWLSFVQPLKNQREYRSKKYGTAIRVSELVISCCLVQHSKNQLLHPQRG